MQFRTSTRSTDRYLNKRDARRQFRVGDFVRITTKDRGNNCKSKKTWQKGYQVVAKKRKSMYQLRHEETGTLEVIHEDRIQLCPKPQPHGSRGRASNPAERTPPNRSGLRSGQRREREEEEVRR